MWVEGPNSFEFAALEGLLRVPLVLGLLSSPSWSWGEGSNMDANGLWVVSLRICHFELSAPLSLSISVSLSLALFFSFRPSAFHTASSVSKTVSLPASMILGGGGGWGRAGNWNNRCPSQNRPFFWGLGRGQGERGWRRGCPSQSPSHFSSQWFCWVWGCEEGRGRSRSWARSADPALVLPHPLQALGNADTAFRPQNRTLVSQLWFPGREERTAGAGSEGWGQLDIRPREEA